MSASDTESPNLSSTLSSWITNVGTGTGNYVEIPRTSAESITRLNTIQTKNGEVDSNYSIEKGVQEAKTYTDNSLSWYEDGTQS